MALESFRMKLEVASRDQPVLSIKSQAANRNAPWFSNANLCFLGPEWSSAVDVAAVTPSGWQRRE